MVYYYTHIFSVSVEISGKIISLKLTSYQSEINVGRLKMFCTCDTIASISDMGLYGKKAVISMEHNSLLEAVDVDRSIFVYPEVIS